MFAFHFNYPILGKVVPCVLNYGSGWCEIITPYGRYDVIDRPTGVGRVFFRNRINLLNGCFSRGNHEAGCLVLLNIMKSIVNSLNLDFALGFDSEIDIDE